MASGTVFLVGAGPGDPKLLTVGGKDALSLADIVVYDRLVHPSLLDHAPAGAERVYVGKQADRHTLTQDKINDLLLENALAGKTVVRLKGGDPLVFGRGGEEAEHLRNHGVRYVIIPGITSAIAAPAYAGIPVTHRDAASSFVVVTGHERAESRESGGRSAGEAEQRRQWDRLAFAADTLVFLMGVENLREITENLIKHGRSPSTPIALVRWGTWAGKQQTLVGQLGTIVAQVAAAGFKAPAVTIIGDVVSLRDRLQWWDNRPLSGKKILVTRAREQASGLVELLASEGAEPIEFPTIRIQEPSDNYAELDQSLADLGNYSWIVFSSANAVASVFARLAAAGKDARAFAGMKIAAVGSATAERLRAVGITADFIPTKFVGEEIARELPVSPIGQTFLVPRAKEANETLAETLTSLGGVVRIVTAYETVMDNTHSAAIAERIADGDIDVVTFTSSSTVKNFVTALGAEPPSLLSVKLACIGPSTAQTARELFQREPDILAEKHTISGLVDALKLFYRKA